MPPHSNGIFTVNFINGHFTLGIKITYRKESSDPNSMSENKKDR